MESSVLKAHNEIFPGASLSKKFFKNSKQQRIKKDQRIRLFQQKEKFSASIIQAPGEVAYPL